MTEFDFSRFQFGKVLDFPTEYEIYDFSRGYDPERGRAGEYGVGRYNERRPGMYTTSLFTKDQVRDIHVGIDLAAPAGSSVYAFFDGRIYKTAINAAAGDYGGTVITEHQLGERTLWALHGHLSHKSVSLSREGMLIRKGDVIGWLGEKAENGGWNPHLHFQLSWEKPAQCDLPGAVNETDLVRALNTYPDPRQVLGPLY